MNWQERFSGFLGRPLGVASRTAGATGKQSIVKRGMASFYVVIFAMLVFIVLVLAFINIMLSETLQSSGSDLSASALDSAQAGVEDAKTALMQCINSAGSITLNDIVSEGYCAQLFSGDCDSLSQYLYRSSDEVAVGDTSVNQAYTCVTLSSSVDSLKSTLSPTESNGSVFIVPLYKANSTYSSVQIQWYSESDRESSGGTSFSSNTELFFPASTQKNNLPLLSVQMINASDTSSSTAAINTAADWGVALFYPAANGASSGALNHDSSSNSTTLGGVTVKKDLYAAGSNDSVNVDCEAGDTDGYSCSYTITNASNLDYLVITNPYNDRQVSVQVTALDSSGNAISFSGVQVEVDSTGRASDYYRRIQTRLTLADPDVPIPTYALSLSGGDSDEGLSKNLAVTRNCWSVSNGTLTQNCANAMTPE